MNETEFPKEIKNTFKEIEDRFKGIEEILVALMDWAKIKNIKDEKNHDFKMKIFNGFFPHKEEIEKIFQKYINLK